MPYVIADTLLKVTLSTNQTGHHVRYTDIFLKVALNINKVGLHVIH